MSDVPVFPYDAGEGSQSVPVVGDRIGAMVSHFLIESRLGSGGMGVVYRARDLKLDRPVALKFLPPFLTQDAGAIERFVQEAKAASALDHSNICTIHEIGEAEDGQTFIAMALYEGELLRQVMDRGPVPIKQALSYTIQIVEGLAAAHAKGIIHRDVKPSNVIVTSGGQIKLLDFGLARLPDAALTRTGSTLGTAAYMSPEQARGEPVDQRTDLWSVGVLLYEMLAGVRPFPGDYEQAVIYAILNSAPEDLRQKRARVPSALATIVHRLLEKDRVARYTSADELVRALKSVQDATVPPSIGGKRRLSWPLSALLAALLLITLFYIGRPMFIARPAEATGASSVAVMYFENQTGEARLERILVELLTTNLGRYEGLQVVSGQRLFDILKRMGKEDVPYVSRDVATEVARSANVKTMVLGSIVQLGGQIRINAQLVDAQSGDILATVQESGGKVEEVFAMVDRLTQHLATELQVDAGRTMNVADVTTDSYEAYRHYQQGLERINRWDFDGARGQLELAVAIDSTFAAAHALLGLMYGQAAYVIIGSNSASPLARRSLEIARRHAGAVSGVERQAIEAIYYVVHGDYPRARAAAEEWLRLDPDLMLALHVNMRLAAQDADYVRAAQYARRMIVLDPTYANAYNALAYFYSDLGEQEQAFAAVRKYRALQPDVYNPYDSSWEIFTRAGHYSQAYDAAMAALKQNPGWVEAHLLAGQTRLFQGRNTEAIAHFQQLGKVDPSWSPISALYAGMALAYTGNMKQAVGYFQAAASEAKRHGQTMRESMALAALGSLQAERGQYAAALKALDEAYQVSNTDDHLVAVRRVTIAYLAARSCLLAGDESCLAERRDRLRQEIRTLGDPVQRDLDYLLEAARLGRAGRDEAALRVLDRGTNWMKMDSPEYVVIRANSYLRSGTPEKAVEAWEAFRHDIRRSTGMTRFSFLLERSRIDYRLGMIYEQMGQRAKAIEHYRLQLERWKNADPEMPMLADTRRRLERLTAR